MSLVSRQFGPCAPLASSVTGLADSLEAAVLRWRVGEAEWSWSVVIGMWKIMEVRVVSGDSAGFRPSNALAEVLRVRISSVYYSAARTGDSALFWSERVIETKPNVVSPGLMEAIEDLRDIGRQAERVLFDILMNSTVSLMAAGLPQERIEEAVRTAVVVDVLGS